MPGYGIEDSPDGLLTWDEALRRLVVTRNFWLATVRPDGRPHLMPVWAVWLNEALWFSCSNGSRVAKQAMSTTAFAARSSLRGQTTYGLCLPTGVRPARP